MRNNCWYLIWFLSFLFSANFPPFYWIFLLSRHISLYQFVIYSLPISHASFILSPRSLPFKFLILWFINSISHISYHAVYTHTHTSAHTYTHAHTYMHTCIQTLVLSHSHTHTHTLTRTHTYTNRYLLPSQHHIPFSMPTRLHWLFHC